MFKSYEGLSIAITWIYIVIILIIQIVLRLILLK